MFNTACLLLVCGLQLSSAAITKRNTDDAIQYPGPKKERVLTTPQDCMNKNYCTTKPDNYPEKLFDEIFKDLKTLAAPSLVYDPLGNRQGDVEEEDNCASTILFEPIYYVDTDSGRHIVVQVKSKNYYQRLRLEVCEQPKSECFKVFLPVDDYQTGCFQKMSPWNLLVWNQAKNTTEQVTIDLPVGCACRYRSVTKY